MSSFTPHTPSAVPSSAPSPSPSTPSYLGPSSFKPFGNWVPRANLTFNDLSTFELQGSIITQQEEQSTISELESSLSRKEKEHQHVVDQVNALDAQLSEYKRRITDLELKCTSTEGHARELAIKNETLKEQVERRAKQNSDQNAELQAFSRFALENEAALKAQITKLEAEVAHTKNTYDNRVKALEKERSSLLEQVDGERRHKTRPSLPEAGDAVRLAMQGQIDKLQAQVDHYKEQATKLTRDLERASQQATTLTPAPHTVDQRLHDNEVVIHALRAEVQKYIDMEQTYREAVAVSNNLMARHESNEQLAEELRIARAKLARMDGLQDEAARAHAECEALRRERKQYTQRDEADKEEGHMVTLEGLRREIETLRKENQVLVFNQGELQVQLKRMEVEAGQDRAAVQSATQELEGARARVGELEEASKRAERRLNLALKERDGIKRILDSYSDDEGGQQLRDMRIAELERTLSDREAHAHTLEEEMAALRRTRTDTTGSAEIEAWKTKVTRLNQEVDELARDNAKLQQRVGRGDFDPSRTRILHLAATPSIIKEGLENERLKAEVAQLRAQLEGTSGAATSAQVQALQKQVHDLDTLNTRLKEVFKHKTHEFREAVHHLLGYKVEMLDKQYRLHSKYSSKPEDCLMFQAAPSSPTDKTPRFDLLETPFSRQFDEAIRTYLVRMNSLPAFLSHITIELFSNKTFQP
eukprot:TRINITY_DN7407_c0_g1_i3.p1 TRINITY_DN7407_c0_g1~~TRINITY_DN7407_c0_g1_i3.p1  ORF type:complete len:716 (+),score=224.38 TRINITY_DN7407_c0_g1_i3:39-2150(+)